MKGFAWGGNGLDQLRLAQPIPAFVIFNFSVISAPPREMKVSSPIFSCMERFGRVLRAARLRFDASLVFPLA